MVRSAAAVIAGYLIFLVSAVALFQFSRRDPHAAAAGGFMAAGVTYSGVFGALAGYAAAAIGGRKEMAHAGAVAAIIGAIALVSLLAQPGKSHWTQLGAIFVAVPLTMAGGWLRARRAKGETR